jgi:hypothetical protein
VNTPCERRIEKLESEGLDPEEFDKDEQEELADLL